MGLYDNIKIVCKNKGISINRLEKELEFPRSSISKFNKNKPSIEKLQKIANYLDVAVDYILTGNESTREDESKITTKGKIDSEDLDPIYIEMQELIARNGNKLTNKERILLIKLLSELHNDEDS